MLAGDAADPVPVAAIPQLDVNEPGSDLNLAAIPQFDSLTPTPLASGWLEQLLLLGEKEPKSRNRSHRERNCTRTGG